MFALQDYGTNIFIIVNPAAVYKIPARRLARTEAGDASIRCLLQVFNILMILQEDAQIRQFGEIRLQIFRVRADG